MAARLRFRTRIRSPTQKVSRKRTDCHSWALDRLTSTRPWTETASAIPGSHRPAARTSHVDQKPSTIRTNASPWRLTNVPGIVRATDLFECQTLGRSVHDNRDVSTLDAYHLGAPLLERRSETPSTTRASGRSRQWAADGWTGVLVHDGERWRDGRIDSTLWAGCTPSLVCSGACHIWRPTGSKTTMSASPRIGLYGSSHRGRMRVVTITRRQSHHAERPSRQSSSIV